MVFETCLKNTSIDSDYTPMEIKKKHSVRNLFKHDLIFNVFVGQLIAMSMVSGGVFTQNL